MTTGHVEEIPDLASLTTTSNRMIPILQRYSTDRGALERKYPIQISDVCRNRIRRFLTGWLNAIESLEFDSLEKEERIDFLLFRNHLNFSVRKLDQRSAQLEEMAGLIPFAKRILHLEEERFAMQWADPETSAAELSCIANSVKEAHQAISEDKVCGQKAVWERVVANRAAEAIKSLEETLKQWHVFYNGFDPMFTWWTDAPYQAAAQALDAYRDYVVQNLVKSDSESDGDIIGDPIGSEMLAAELEFEMIPYSPEELIRIANRELAWCEAEMAAAANELGFGNDTRAALEHVKTLHAPPGGQPELVKSLALEAVEYLDEHDLLTVPPLVRELWRLDMMSAEKQRVNPFFLGGEVIQVSFPTNTMSHEEKQMSMRGNNAHFARATVQHELIPGHHLQGYMQERYRSYREPFCTPFWIEGWTIYWEFLLYKLGFPKSPEDRIGMLFWRIHRCVRVIFSLSFHLEKITPRECIEMLVERVGHERANAVAEVRRSCGGVYPPLYQCAYLVGGLQMWALRSELVDSRKMPEKAFHDAVIQQNCIPIEMVRADLIGRELSKDFTSSWRFYKTGDP